MPLLGHHVHITQEFSNSAINDGSHHEYTSSKPMPEDVVSMHFPQLQMIMKSIAFRYENRIQTKVKLIAGLPFMSN